MFLLIVGDALSWCIPKLEKKLMLKVSHQSGLVELAAKVDAQTWRDFECKLIVNCFGCHILGNVTSNGRNRLLNF